MSSDKTKRSERLHDDLVAAERQRKIAKHHNNEKSLGHYVKLHAMTCGDSNCVMCGNPRKFFGEETIQEKSFKQTDSWLEE